MAFAVLPMESSALVTAVHSQPLIFLILAKMAIGAPLFYHSFNGIRHLVSEILTN